MTELFHLIIRSSDSFLPKTYGLPKIYKKELSFRIIVSSGNTALHKIGTYLHKIIYDNVPPDSFAHNSFECTTSIELISSETVFSLDNIALYKYSFEFSP